MSFTPQYKFSRTATLSRRSNRVSIWQRLHIDPWLLLILLTLAALGLTVLYSASDGDLARVKRQAIGFAIAFGLLISMAQIPPRIYKDFSPFFYVGGTLLLVGVMLFGEVRMGAQRWLGIPGLGSVQPSEFMKLAMPMMVAWFLARRSVPPSLLSVTISLALIGMPVLLIAEQPDLGTSLLVAASGVFVLFLAGLSWRIIGICLAAFAAFVPIAWQFLLHDYQKRRVMTLLNPEADALGAGWNILQSKTAIGSGGLSGKGYLNGTQSHLHFLPEGHTDFIIAAFSEELGLVGVVLLVILYLALIFRAFYIATTSHLSYNRLLAGAIALSFFVYVFVNMGMVSGILPVVGVPLPFISYGGTAVITLMAGFGLLMSIHTHKPTRL